jgi:hypothetical protein
VVLAVVVLVMRVGGFEPISGLGWVLWMWRGVYRVGMRRLRGIVLVCCEQFDGNCTREWVCGLYFVYALVVSRVIAAETKKGRCWGSLTTFQGL